MYTSYYAQNSMSAGEEQRSQELLAVQSVIENLEIAKENGSQSEQGKIALHKTLLVWSYLLEDLSKSDNGLPDQLRADLISVGIFIIKEINRVHQGTTDNLDTLIDLNKIISTGLSR